MKRPHHDLIQKWLDDPSVKIQILFDDWEDIEHPTWNERFQYRIKPKETVTRIEWVPLYSSWLSKRVVKWEMRTIVEEVK